MFESFPSLAFAGLGLMGLPMCRRLQAAGYPLTVWNRTADKCLPLLAKGGHRVESPAELCVAAEIVILVLLNAVEKIILSLDRVYDLVTALEKIAAGYRR